LEDATDWVTEKRSILKKPGCDRSALPGGFIENASGIFN
jgi:hypothetical protein